MAGGVRSAEGAEELDGLFRLGGPSPDGTRFKALLNALKRFGPVGLVFDRDSLVSSGVSGVISTSSAPPDHSSSRTSRRRFLGACRSTDLDRGDSAGELPWLGRSTRRIVRLRWVNVFVILRSTTCGDACQN